MCIRSLSIEKRKFAHSLIFPGLFVITIWLVKISEVWMNANLGRYGIFPLKTEGLIGILFSPLIHGDFFHLFDNTIPLFVLSVTVFYYYNRVAYLLFFLIWLLTGILVWLIARDAYHIGASGIIYGLGAFIFLSGVIRNDLRLLIVFMAVTFIYASFIYGVFPIEEKVSWESHLTGALTGMLLAVLFRNFGPPPIKYAWQGDIDEEDEMDNGEDNNKSSEGMYYPNKSE